MSRRSDRWRLMMTLAFVETSGSDRPAGSRRVALIVVGALFVLSAILLWRGHGFYALDLHARVDHPDFRRLSPGGPIGHGYGVIGMALILTNLLYLARRRFARLRLGSMRSWLHMHVFTGLFGSVLIVFHSAFQLRSAVPALTSVSLALVVVSGLIGRYFYGLAPRSDAEALDHKLTALDVLVQGLGERIAAGLRALPPPSLPAHGGLGASLVLVPRWRAEARARAEIVRRAAANCAAADALDRAHRRHLRRTLRDAARLSQDPVRAVAGDSLLRSWRGLHRFMALLMIVSATAHVAIAWMFGSRWIFTD